MTILDKIENFTADIYYKMPNEINNDYIALCKEISQLLDNNFSNNDDIMEQKNELLQYLLSVMETNDYIRMADALYYNVKPIIEDINIYLKDNLN